MVWGASRTHSALWGAFLSWDGSRELHTTVAFNAHPFTRVDVNTILHLRKCKSGITGFLGVRSSVRTELGTVLLGSVQRTHAGAHTLSCFSCQVLSCRCWLSPMPVQSPSQSGVVRRQQPLHWTGEPQHPYLSWVNPGLICT